jgi:diguanylate cyclase
MPFELTTLVLAVAVLVGLFAGVAASRFGPVVSARLRAGRTPTPGANAGAEPSDTGEVDRRFGLMSRSQFEAELEDRLAQAEKHGRDSCVVHIVADGLRKALAGKTPEFCDAALAATALRLRAVCGASVPLARLAEEDYGLWLDAPREAAEKLAVRLTEDFQTPVRVDGLALEFSLSVGLALSPEQGSGVRLFRKAVAATRSVQRNGGGAHAVFDPRIGAEHNDELALAKELQEALRRHQLELFFQPKIDARHFDVDTIECLLRWRHPVRGLVNPARIVEVAERQGLMEPLGLWILNALLKTGASWREAGLSVNLALNLSGVQFRDDELAATLQQALKEHGISPGTLVCEVPEAVAMETNQATRRAFSRLRELGVRIAISDFKGCAAGLAALTTLPVQEVKISRELVAAMADDQQAQQVVERIVAAAQARQMRVVAEGVESPAQRDHALRLGCDLLQGYLFVRPMSARAVSIWAADARVNLSQALPLSQFKDTLPASLTGPLPEFASTDVMGLR